MSNDRIYLPDLMGSGVTLIWAKIAKLNNTDEVLNPSMVMCSTETIAQDALALLAKGGGA